MRWKCRGEHGRCIGGVVWFGYLIIGFLLFLRDIIWLHGYYGN